MENEEEFYVCDHHCRTGGYESCCECENDDPEDDRVCTESLRANK